MRQHGVVSRQQLLAAGVSKDALQQRIGTRWLRRIHRGIYGVGPILPARAREMAAWLACGPGAVISHQSAAGLWGSLEPEPPDAPVHVGLARGSRRHPKLHTHRLASLQDDELGRVDGIPVTIPARTLLDLAYAASPRTLERAVDRTLDRRLATHRDVQRIMERHSGRPGSRRLRAVLERERTTLTNSEAEERFLDLVRRAGFDPPETNARLGGYVVDFLWRSALLVVEVDGYAFHSSSRAFERDRRRDADLARLGFRVVRVTWRQLVNEPLRLVVVLARALQSGPARTTRGRL